VDHARNAAPAAEVDVAAALAYRHCMVALAGDAASLAVRRMVSTAITGAIYSRG